MGKLPQLSHDFGMKSILLSRISSVALGLVGALSALLALVVCPGYAYYMVVWMHAPQLAVLATTLPMFLVFSAGAFFEIRESVRLWAWGPRVEHQT